MATWPAGGVFAPFEVHRRFAAVCAHAWMISFANNHFMQSVTPAEDLVHFGAEELKRVCAQSIILC